MVDTISYEKDGEKVNEIISRSPEVKEWEDKEVLLEGLQVKLDATDAGIVQGQAIIESYTAEKANIQTQIDAVNLL